MKTFSPKPEHIERRWYVVDAEGAVLGRLATHVASLLRGKHKPIWAPHVDAGDHVVVVNAGKVRLTGTKDQSKTYRTHSQHPGGLRTVDFERMLATRPHVVVERAVRGMLPKNRLGRQMLRKLSVYAGPQHRHAAQKPEPLQIGEVPPWSGLPAPKPKPEPRPDEETRRPRGRRAGRSAPAKAGPARKATVRKAGAKRAPAKAAARRPAKATAKKAAAKKATAKRTTRRTTKAAPKRSARRTTKES